MVWTCSPEAAFLKGKLVWATWDAAELGDMKEQIQDSSKLTIGLTGYPPN